ncbi:MAG: Protein-export membrane protein SecF [Candidatus Woesearchaeota archaeon]|nr:Protein-export membrane protein SecF [Candidatus Woesearchaeota archaeon]
MQKKQIRKKKQKQEKTKSLSFEKRIEQIYDKEYKHLVIIPTIIALIAFGLILAQYFQTGDFVHKGISLKGGTTLKIHTDKEINVEQLEKQLEKTYPGEEFSVRVIRNQEIVEEIEIGTSLQSEKVLDVISIIEGFTGEIGEKDYSVETIGSSLSESFFKEILKVLLLAFVLMAAVVFIYFKSFIPSVSAVLAAFFNIIITLAIINMTGVKISSAGIAAFLMLIGYSIDTDTMLTARVLKRDADTSVFQAIKSAFKTGMTMSAAGLGATLTAYFFSTSAVIKQIMIILVIGLLVDMMTTWVQNAGLLRWYIEHEKN